MRFFFLMKVFFRLPFWVGFFFLGKLLLIARQPAIQRLHIKIKRREEKQMSVSATSQIDEPFLLRIAQPSIVRGILEASRLSFGATRIFSAMRRGAIPND